MSDNVSARGHQSQHTGAKMFGLRRHSDGLGLRVAASDDGTTTSEAPGAGEEASCDAASVATEEGGAGANTACNAAATGQAVAPAGCSTGWKHAMAGRPQTKPGWSIHCRSMGTACSPW